MVENGKPVMTYLNGINSCEKFEEARYAKISICEKLKTADSQTV